MSMWGLVLLLLRAAAVSEPSNVEAAAAAVGPVCKSSGTADDAACFDPTISLLQTNVHMAHRGHVILHEHSLGTPRLQDEKEVSLVRTYQKDQPLSNQVWEKALGPGGVDYKAMHQGLLGDCYFLAALVSIAYTHKEIISGMFTNGDLLQGANPVYTTKWRINGKQTTVVMNEMLPVNAKNGELFFAKGKQGTYWPSMLEKAWAKIFGNYKNIESGVHAEAFKAITQAPVVNTNHKAVIAGVSTSKAKYWQLLVDATNKKYVMGASTSGGANCNSIGLYCGHAYAILRAVKYNEWYPQALEMYNPHGADRYIGMLPNEDKTDGIFYVTFDELVNNFGHSDVGEVLANAVASEIVLSKDAQRTIALEFYMDTDEPFHLQLEWPSWRFIDKSCDVVEPVFTVAVARQDSPTTHFLLKKPTRFMTNARATLPGGWGRYVVFVNVRFPNSKSWLKDFVVNVYGPSTQLAPSTQYPSPIDLFLTMTGLCRTIMVPGTGYFKSQAAGEFKLDEYTEVNGMPVFRGTSDAGASSQKNVQRSYKVIYWDALRQTTTRARRAFGPKGTNQWQLMSSVENAKRGSTYPKFAGIPGASCSNSMLQQDPPLGPAVPAADAVPTAPEEPTFFDEDGAPIDGGAALIHAGHDAGADSATATDTDLDENCGSKVDRLSRLGTVGSMAWSSSDPEFPETLKSIAQPWETCGDTATGEPISCNTYNHWEGISAMRAKAAAGGTLGAQCETDCSAKECIPKTAKDGKCSVDFTRCGAGTMPFKYQNSYGQGGTVTAAGIVDWPAWVCNDDTFGVK